MAHPAIALPQTGRISGTIIGAAIRIHTELGPGLKETVYERVLARDLRRSGLLVERQKSLSFEFEGMHFHGLARPDSLSRTALWSRSRQRGGFPVFFRQTMTYLKLLDCRLGLILNFGMPRMKDGITRVINGYGHPAPDSSI